MAIYLAVVFGFYFLLLIILWVGWRKAIDGKTITASENKFISVIIAVRNEKHNLEKLFNSLSSQTYPSANFEVILIDDHSADDSLVESKKWIDRLASSTILSLNETQIGKKAALAFGINQAKGEIIATTDADCILPVDWLRQINEGFQNKNTNMLIGAVALRNNSNFFSELQSIEFASVIGTSLALCALGKPTMCNGANLSFRKSVFEEVKGYEGNDHIASGDDEFLMRKILDKYPSAIKALNLRDSVVSTYPQESIRDFIQQRLRWASKWKANSSVFARSLAVFMFVTQMVWLGLMTWVIVDKSFIAILILFLKLMIDFLFLSSVCYHLKMKFNPFAFACLQFLYPVYVLCVGVFSQFKDYQWKGRVASDENTWKRNFSL